MSKTNKATLQRRMTLNNYGFKGDAHLATQKNLEHKLEKELLTQSSVPLTLNEPKKKVEETMSHSSISANVVSEYESMVSKVAGSQDFGQPSRTATGNTVRFAVSGGSPREGRVAHRPDQTNQSNHPV